MAQRSTSFIVPPHERQRGTTAAELLRVRPQQI
jgi:hypothetical protein